MRTLLAHNYYGTSAPSGENQVFDLECAMLARHGHTVGTFIRHSDSLHAAGVLGVVRGAMATPWNPFAVWALKRAAAELKPDVFHVHNTFPLLSPAIFSAFKTDVARVLTLHNYRLFCPAAIPMRAGEVCTECMDARSVVPALRYGCYRGSRMATLPLAASVSLHRTRGTWDRDVDAFIVLSEFQRQMMVAAGLPSARVFVKPNFFPGNPCVVEWGSRSTSVVFAGRLTAEKGVETLVRAWVSWGKDAPQLNVLGAGPLRQRLEALAHAGPACRVAFLGQLPAAQAEQHIARARLVIVPSECFEGYPMVVREAFAFGTPVAASAIGPLTSIVQSGVSGVVFTPRDPGALLGVVRAAWEAPGLLRRLSAGARTTFESTLTEQANHKMLMDVYAAALATAGERTRGGRGPLRNRG